MSILAVDGFACGGEGVLKVIKFVFTLLDMALFIIPMALIVMLSVDLVKNVMAGNTDAMGKNFKLAVKRILMCMALFLVQPIVHFSINLLGNLGVDFLKCVEISLNDDLSQYKIDYSADDYDGVAEPNFNKSPGYTPSKKNNDTSEASGQDGSSKANTGEGSAPITEVMEIQDKKDLVAIMYTTWFDAILPNGSPIISNTKNYTRNKYYFWGEPEVGFYKSSDKAVIKKHMQLLTDAGIDFIIIDNTNVSYKKDNANWNIYVTKPVTALLDTIVEMRKNGQKTPYVVNWIYTGNVPSSYGKIPFVTWDSVNSIYDQFYTQEKYKDVWVYWNGKPFILTTSTPTSSAKRSITTRSMWGLNGVSSVNWSYLEANNDKPGKDSKGNVEQIGVSTAMQATYMSNTSTATGRKNGNTFYQQWRVAFKYHPKIVTITWWNEWCAINLGNGTFTDLYSQEYSRDIEPMKGGHGDTYYQWMKQYIQAYKSNQSCPKLTSG